MRLLPLAALLLVGCSTTWTHPSKSQQDFYRDNSQCMSMAGAGQAQPMMPGIGAVQSGYNQGAAMSAAANQKTMYEHCMFGNGWAKQ